jgi:hypothetical protein
MKSHGTLGILNYILRHAYLFYGQLYILLILGAHNDMHICFILRYGKKANNICIFIVMSALILLLNGPLKGNLLLSKLE